jgi:hypothetical protein
MGTPAPGWYGPSMFDYAGIEVAWLVRQVTPTDKKILDIGSGWGKYRWLLPEYEFDAAEVWEPYVKQHNLDSYYGNVFIGEAVKYNYPYRYGAVILGDVLEHMSVEDAQQVLDTAYRNSDLVVVAVPFLHPQGEEEGNCFEIHLQEDLTETVMTERYPDLTLYSSDGHKAVYVYHD